MSDKHEEKLIRIFGPDYRKKLNKIRWEVRHHTSNLFKRSQTKLAGKTHER